MRESNLAFPGQNRASVCITSQLYDRRALDTTSALPLFNSLTHLTFLTSTSPRIREIMTMDGGLERLVRILHDFCVSPPPPENAAAFYGLGPPIRPGLHPKSAGNGTLNPVSFDKHAAFRFSLAFQCVVNIGVRGSEPIRSRVVQAGTLDVVGCILEAWLSSKGFAVGPNVALNGYGTGATRERETKEQRAARRLESKEARQKQEAADLARALQRSIQLEQEREHDGYNIDSMDVSPAQRTRLTPAAGPSNAYTSDGYNAESDVDTSADASLTVTPLGTNTPTGTVLVPTRHRSGTVIARTVWDERQRTRHVPSQPPTPQSPSPDTSRPETETEDDGDVDMDRDLWRTARHTHGRAIGIVSDTAPAPISTDDAHINIIVGGQDRNLLLENLNINGQGVEDGIVLMEANDDFALGAPPGAPGAILGQLDVEEGESEAESISSAQLDHVQRAPDETPRPGIISLPPLSDHGLTHSRNATLRGRTVPGAELLAAAATLNANNTTAPSRTNTLRANTRTATNTSSNSHSSTEGPYRDEDVLLALQLLAYLSKYPHVRQAFYEPRVGFHPVNQIVTPAPTVPVPSSSKLSTKEKESTNPSSSFFRAFTSATSRGKQKSTQVAASSGPTIKGAPRTNVFALVERFTFRPSSGDKERERARLASIAATAASNGVNRGAQMAMDIPKMPARLPPEIQYWAGVIMRNACRKDDSRGGIRQCANMLCGRWESYPREFAKCRRCRKAKYCGKECQSTAWSEGHRFWCSVKDTDGEFNGTVAENTTHSHRHHRHHHTAHPEPAANGWPLVIPPAPVAIPPTRPQRFLSAIPTVDPLVQPRRRADTVTANRSNTRIPPITRQPANRRRQSGNTEDQDMVIG